MAERFLILSCANCGHALDVFDDMERFACAHCGATMAVQRRGGTVQLNGVEPVHRVRVGQDNTAAEHALARLAEEQQKLAKQKSKLKDENFRRATWGFGIGGVVLLAGLVAAKTVKNLNRAPKLRAELPPGLALRVETLRSLLAEVCPMTKEQWLDSLRRDMNPEKEVLWWERVAGCFTTFVAQRDYLPEQRQAVFKILFGLCSGMREQDLASDLAKLSESDLVELAVTAHSIAH
jgi:ribosomal protein S27E